MPEEGNAGRQAGGGDLEPLLQEARHHLEMAAYASYYSEYMSDIERAAELCEQIVRLDPENLLGWRWLGECRKRLDRKEEALEAYCQALRCQPDDRQMLAEKGKLLMDLGRYEEALEVWNLLHGPENKDPRLWFQKGLALEALERREEALSCFQEAIRQGLETPYEDALQGPFRLAGLLAALGRSEEALAAYRGAFRSYPPEVGAGYTSSVWFLDALARYDEARLAFEEATRVLPQPHVAWYRAARAFLEAGRAQEALRCCQEALRALPKESGARLIR
ncbi:MAG TPA: tetratricopeptide repeat protein, partial [Candidatus Nitrosotenuis sp.]|nr:tetratricopeptide repeat protein [Candidatus Nitrosotenuis sp.]